jgi:hypothetical protein
VRIERDIFASGVEYGTGLKHEVLLFAQSQVFLLVVVYPETRTQSSSFLARVSNGVF